MFNFSCDSIDDIVIEMPGKIARHCRQYIVDKENKVQGKVSVGDKFGIIEFQNHSLIIDRKQKLFRQKIYHFKSKTTGHSLGILEFLDTQGECIISIDDGSSYFFHRNTAVKSILKPRTWFLFEHLLTDSKDKISFRAKGSSLLVGHIESTNEQLILPILLGLFIIEENVRTAQENSG